jgi:methionyl-tRNA synthetase
VIVRSLNRVEMSRSYDMLVQPLLSSDDTTRLPFGGGFGIVEPGTISKRHGHHECEMFVILSGRAIVEVGDERRHVSEGEIVLIPPFVHHAIENDADAPLEMISLCWEDAVEIEAALDADGGADADAAPREALLLCPPPTPNGGLHLGHVAGPYLRADVCRRAIALRGGRARLVTGTDDNQAYVTVLARAADKEPGALAEQQGARIVRTLERLAIDVDLAIRPQATEGYRTVVQAAFARLADADAVSRRDLVTLHCETCSQSLYEAHVRGRCPSCGAPSCGELCESCGFPNHAAELLEPTCVRCGGPASQRMEPALMLSLAACEGTVRRCVRSAVNGEHVASLIERLCSAGLPDYRLTHSEGWGVPVPAPGFAGHVIDAAVEVLLSFVLVGEAPGRQRARRIQFLGYDGSFYHAVLYPALADLLGEGWSSPDALVVNELLTLDGSKFSTSQQHAVWADDVLDDVDREALRLAMLCHSPEAPGDDFTTADLERIVGGTLTRPIAAWLDGFVELSETLAGVVPAAGAWTAAQRGFYRQLNRALMQANESWSPDTFSMRAYAGVLLDLVAQATRFRALMRPLAGGAVLGEELRTAQTLELAAAKTFAIIAAPAMPGLADRLRAELGLAGPLRYESLVSLLPAGTRLGFERRPYFDASVADAPADPNERDRAARRGGRPRRDR